MPFVEGTRLLVGTGMHGATGNVYVGLTEFEDMAFVLHLLREGDQFLDVGANVGVYSILAAGRGARVLAMEPVPDTYEQLLDNIHLNRFATRIEVRNVGVGRESGELRFTTDNGPTDHVLAPDETAVHATTVTVDALDSLTIGWQPIMMKIDVEGFEANVIAGAAQLLNAPSLQAVLIELNGLGARYGFSDDNIHNELMAAGFSPARYEPSTRRLLPLEGHRTAGNTLYIRDLPVLEQRLHGVAPVQVAGFDV